MAINRFDVASQAEFINTYNPIPFQELAQASQMRQGKHEENLARLDQARAAADQINAISGTYDERLRNEMVSNIENISDKYYSEDLSDPEVYRALRTDLSSAVDKKELRRVQDNYARWQENQQLKRQMQAKGLWNPALDADPARDPNFGAAGEVYDYTPTAYLPKEQTLDPYFDELKQLTLKNQNRDGFMIHGRDMSDVESVVGNYAGNYLNSVSGQQEVELFRKNNPEAAQNMDDLEIAQTIMRDYGKRYIREEANAIPGYFSGKGKSSFSGFNTGFGVTKTEGADIDQIDVRDAEKEVQEIERTLGSGAVSDLDRVNLESRKAELEGVLTSSRQAADTQFEEAVANKRQSILEEIEDPTVQGLVTDYIDRYQGQPVGRSAVVSPTTSAYSEIEIPGEEELRKDLMESLGLNRREANKAVKKYNEYMQITDTDRRAAENVYRDLVKQQLSPSYSGEMQVTYPYLSSQGQPQYRNIWDENKIKPSYLQAIISDVNTDPDMFKITETSGKGPAKVRGLLEDIDKGEKVVNNANVRYNLTDDGNISVKADVYNKDNDNKPTGEKEGQINLELVHPEQKQAVMQEMFEMGNFRGAYGVSKMADRIANTVKYTVSEGRDGEIPLDQNTRVSIKQEGDKYTINILDALGTPKLDSRGEAIPPKTVRGKQNAIDEVQDLVYTSVVPDKNDLNQVPVFPLMNGFAWSE